MLQHYVIPQFAVVELDENGKMVWKGTFLHSFQAEKFIKYLREQNGGETMDIDRLLLQADKEQLAREAIENREAYARYQKGIADGTIKPARGIGH